MGGARLPPACWRLLPSPAAVSLGPASFVVERTAVKVPRCALGPARRRPSGALRGASCGSLPGTVQQEGGAPGGRTWL